MTVPKVAGHSTGTTNRTRLPKVIDIAFRHCGVRPELADVVRICDDLNVPFGFKQGQPSESVVRLSWTDRSRTVEAGPFPGRFRGTEALTADGLQIVLNYLSATSPEAA